MAVYHHAFCASLRRGGLTSCQRRGFRSPLVQADLSLRILRANKHEEGGVVFRHACKLGLEGIVSKQKGSPEPRGARR